MKKPFTASLQGLHKWSGRWITLAENSGETAEAAAELMITLKERGAIILASPSKEERFIVAYKDCTWDWFSFDALRVIHHDWSI